MCEISALQLKIRKSAETLLSRCAENHITVGTAESCTGGLIAATLTDVPGASAALAGGIVSYANEVKRDRLGVDAQTLEDKGAVSEEVACQMASGARRELSVDVAVSVTGIAGPGGAVPGKPVGTVWIGVSSHLGTSARLHHFDGDRDSVRRQTVEAALGVMLEEIEKELKFTTLHFHRLDDLLASIGIEPCKVCTYCFNGK